MANKIPSRLKTEKVHGAKPYDRPRQSLLHKVASTVRDIFVPSWLLNASSWKTTDEDNESNVKRLETSVQSCSKENLNEPIPQTSRSSYIPPKRPRYNLANTYNRTDQTNELQSEAWLMDSDVTRENTSRIEAPTSAKEFSQSYSYSRKQSQPTVNGDDQSENSEGSASTSGCSSLVSSHNERQDPPQQEHGSSLPISDDGLERLKHGLRSKQVLYEQKSKKDAAVETESVQDLDGSLSHNQLSMWSESIESKLKRNAKPQPIAHGQKPSFTLSSFGTPLLGSPSVKERSFESPFYEGNTMFGGASAYRRARLSALPYQTTRTPRSQMKVRETRLGNDTDCMSTTAKRILQTLEKMSTPLSDAKKIPTTNTTSLDLSLSYTPGSLSHRPSLRSLRKSGDPATYFKGPPVSNIATPSPVTIRNNLEIGVTKSCKKKNESLNKINDKHESSNSKDAVTLTSFTDCSSKGGGKMRVRTHQSLHHSLKQKDEKSETIKEPELPNIPLPISTLPKFSFGIAERNNNGVLKSVEPVSSNDSSPTFTFSLPIAHEAPGVQVSADLQKSTSFTFSSPLIVKQDGTYSNTPVDSLKKISSQFVPGFQQQVDKPEIKKKSEADTAKFSLKTDGELILGGSVMDILSKMQDPSPQKTTDTCKADPKSFDSSCFNPLQSAKQGAKSSTISNLKELSPKGFGEKFKPPPGTWECNTCMVRNEASQNKCVACESSKPSQKKSQQTGSTQGFGEKFKPPYGSWGCPSCAITNKESDFKCVACETPKSGKKTNKTSSASLASSFGDRFKPPPGSWMCPTCMIANNSSAHLCVACETTKPGICISTTATTSNKETTSGFGEKFKPPAESWECDTCLVRNSSDTTKCIACETPQPMSKVADVKQTFSGFKFGTVPKSDTSQFKFGASAVSIANPSLGATEFKFGTPVTDAPKEPNNFTFGGTGSNLTKSQEGFKFGTTVGKSDSTDGFKFGVNSTVPSANNSAITSTPSSSAFKFGHDTSDASKATLPTFKFGDNYSSKDSKLSKSPVTTSNMSFPFGTPSGGNCQASGSFSVSMKPTQTLTTQSKPGCKVSSFEAESEPQTKQTEAEKTTVTTSDTSRTSETTTTTSAAVTTSLSSAPKFSFNFSSTSSKANNKTSLTVCSSLPTFSFTCTPPTSTLAENKNVTTAASATTTGSASVQTLKTSNAFAFGSKNKSSSSEGFTFKKSEEKSANSSQPSFGFFKTDVTTSTSVTSTATLTTAASVVSTTASTSLFKFGVSTSTSFGSGFVFGALKTDADQGTSGGGVSFSLGSGTAANNKQLSSAGFGSFAIRPSQPSTSPVPTFSFGSGSLATVTSSTASTVNVTTSAPSFGTSSNVFKFGANNTSAAGGVTPAPVFGASALNTNTGQPVFGGFSNFSAGTFGQTTQTKQDASSGFSFGAVTPVSTAAVTASAPTPVFRFGAPEDQKLDTPQNSGFNFTFTPKNEASSGFPVFSTPPTFNFSATSTPTGPSEFEAIIEGGPRRIRKAVRRCRNEPK